MTRIIRAFTLEGLVGRPVTWTWHEIRALPPSTLAAQLRADHYIDSSAENPGAALQKLGGAAAIIATAASGASMSPLVGGLAPRGRMVVVGTAPNPISIRTADHEDNLAFSHARGIRPIIEVLPLADAPAAHERMMSGQARFRVVTAATRRAGRSSSN